MMSWRSAVREGARASVRADEPTWEERLKALSNVRSTLGAAPSSTASIEGRHDGAESPCGTESPCSSWERPVSGERRERREACGGALDQRARRDERRSVRPSQ